MIEVEIQVIIKKVDFKKLVKKSGLTFRELSKRSGVSHTYICSLATGNSGVKRIKIETWNKLSPHLPPIK